MAESKSTTKSVGVQLAEFQTRIPVLFTQPNSEAEILKVRKTIVTLKEQILKMNSDFDKCVDMRDSGAFGANAFPKVTRIRAKSDTVGRPRKAEKPNPLLALEI